jgi:protein-L-isoaspartate(D-aspartate) O-methyltransferase
MIDFAAAREAMVDCQVRPSDVTRYPIISAMQAVPREDFVPDGMREMAYIGEHIALGRSRVLLDPRVFAKMLDVIAIGPEDLVLDVGCGLGYSTAVIARMAQAVIALEEDAAMADEAETTLASHGVDNAVLEVAPLADGVPEHGPYDCIVIEGGLEQLPEALGEQLKIGGRIVGIVMEGSNGQARLGVKTAHGVAWRRAFDATAPVLPGFAAVKAFEF